MGVILRHFRGLLVLGSHLLRAEYFSRHRAKICDVCDAMANTLGRLAAGSWTGCSIAASLGCGPVAILREIGSHAMVCRGGCATSWSKLCNCSAMRNAWLASMAGL